MGLQKIQLQVFLFLLIKQLLRESTNFRCTAKFVTDGSRIGTYREGIYVGLLGMLYRKVSKLSLSH